MIYTHVCPFCGSSFKIGFDPEKNKKYNSCSVVLQKLDYTQKYEFYDDGWIRANICEECYNKLYNGIKTKERKMKNEQPKFP